MGEKTPPPADRPRRWLPVQAALPAAARASATTTTTRPALLQTGVVLSGVRPNVWGNEGPNRHRENQPPRSPSVQYAARRYRVRREAPRDRAAGDRQNRRPLSHQEQEAPRSAHAGGFDQSSA